jgi:hypothetical protein
MPREIWLNQLEKSENKSENTVTEIDDKSSLERSIQADGNFS